MEMRYVVTRITGPPIEFPCETKEEALAWMISDNHGNTRYAYRLDELDGISTEPSKTEYHLYMAPRRRGWNPYTALLSSERGRQLEDIQKAVYVHGG